MPFSPLKWPDVRKLAGMMRLGKKYQLDDIFGEALMRLKVQFPETLDAYDSLTSCSNELCEWIAAYFQDIACLGEEMALWSILPITYYIATEHKQSIVSHVSIIHIPSAKISLCDTAEIPSCLSKSPIEHCEIRHLWYLCDVGRHCQPQFQVDKTKRDNNSHKLLSFQKQVHRITYTRPR